MRAYLPPDANCLLSVFDHCLRSRNYVNVVIAGKTRPAAMADHRGSRGPLHRGHRHLAMGQQRSGLASPDLVMACCGDTPTLEILAAVSILREHLPELKIRVVNVVDLMKLQSASEHPHGLSETGLRFPLYQGQARHLRFPWLPVAGPPADLPPGQSQSSCPRLQGRGHHHYRLRHPGAE